MLVILFLTFPSVTYADADLTWIQTIGSDIARDDILAGIAIENGLIVAGSRDLQPGFPIAWIARLEMSGKRRWERIMVQRPQRSTRIRHLIQSGQKDILAVGTVGESEDADIFILLVSSNSGAIKWQYTYGSPGAEAANAVVEAHENGFLIGGVKNARGDDDLLWVKGWGLRIDQHGGVLWQKTYAVSEAGDIIDAIEPRPDGGYVLVGSVIAMDFFRADAWLFKIDSEGYVIWSGLFGDFEGNWHDEAIDIKGTPDGGFLALGSTDTISGKLSDLWLLKFDKYEDLEWQTHYGAGDDDRGLFIFTTPKIK